MLLSHSDEIFQAVTRGLINHSTTTRQPKVERAVLPSSKPNVLKYFGRLLAALPPLPLL